MGQTGSAAEADQWDTAEDNMAGGCDLGPKSRWNSEPGLEPEAARAHTCCGVMEKGTLDREPGTLFEISQQPLERSSCCVSAGRWHHMAVACARTASRVYGEDQNTRGSLLYNYHCLRNSSVPQVPLGPKRPPHLSRQPLIIHEGGAP